MRGFHLFRPALKNTGRQAYGLKLSIIVLAPSRQNADWQTVKRGTVQHEVFEGQRAEPFIDGEVIEIKVNCREDAGKIQNPVAYGLAVSLEVAEGVDIVVYNEI